jgi:hypothetical protein
VQEQHVGLDPVPPRFAIRRGTPQRGERTVGGGGHIISIVIARLIGRSHNPGEHPKSKSVVTGFPLALE